MLNKRVRFYRTDGSTFLHECWADVSLVSIKLATSGVLQPNKQSLFIKVRKQPFEILPEYVVGYKGKLYDIDVISEDPSRRFLQLVVKERLT